MSPTWSDVDPEPTPRISAIGWMRIVLKGVPLATVLFGGLLIHLLVRLVEQPFFGIRRPWTPWITQGVCIASLWIIRLRRHVEGTRMKHPGAVVANHASWLDIFVLNAGKRIYFVSKSEVSGWPVIGWLARAVGTVFIVRDPRQAKSQQHMIEERLKLGHKLLFFPEGTSSDGVRVLEFKSTLFAAFLRDDLKSEMWLQPVTIRYHAPKGMPSKFYGWWGEMNFAGHLLKVLATGQDGSVRVVYHEPHRTAGFPDRKALARACEADVRRAFGAAS